MATILIVDVPEGEASILASALRVEGFEVLIATSAEQARATLARRPVALTIVDLMLRTTSGVITDESGPVSSPPVTVRNGLELARELRMSHPAMRVVLTSAYHLSERQLERADCGVSGFIPKPYDLTEVTTFIRNKVNGPPSSRRMFASDATPISSPPLSGPLSRTTTSGLHARAEAEAEESPSPTGTIATSRGHR